jgi:uncharacterized protein YjbI with pentapeptide repeats
MDKNENVKRINNWLQKIEDSLNEFYFIRKYLSYLILILILIGVIILFIYVANDFDFLAKYFYEGKNAVNGELLKTALTVLGGVGVFYGLYLNSRRIKQQTEQNSITRESNNDNRFSDAVGSLDSKNYSSVLGGIYSLHQLANEDKRYKPIVADLISSYLRNKSNNLKAYDKNINGYNPSRNPNIIAQSIIDILGTEVYNEIEINLAGALLEDLTFKKKVLSKYIFSEAIINNCFFNCSLSDCKFENCNIKDTEFKFSFYDTTFNYSNISDCHFSFFEYDTDDISSFINTSFQFAEITKCRFFSKLFRDVSFHSSHISSCYFKIEMIERGDFIFNDAKEIQFRDTKFVDSSIYRNESVSYSGCFDGDIGID